MTFGEALAALKEGERVQRAGWNGKGMWVVLQPGSDGVLPCLAMKTVTGEMQPGWLASQTDMLAEDWSVVEWGKA